MGASIRRRDYFWIAVFSLLIFGFDAFSGRPLTMHEARLPQTSREMVRGGSWLLPTSGGRPWLERPPLPHWIVASLMTLTGQIGQVWVVRLPSAFMGTVVVLITTALAARWFGRDTAIASALVLCTSLEFYQYSSLAEDDVYLAAVVAVAAYCFVRAMPELAGSADFTGQPRLPADSTLAAKLPDTRPDTLDSAITPPISIERPFRFMDLIGSRSIWLWLFYAVLGISNLTKGPLLGILMLGSAVFIYSIAEAGIQRRAAPVLRMVWLWGAFLLVSLTLAWPMLALRVYPDVLANWKYDYLGRMSQNYMGEKWYYYLPTLLGAVAPWTPACLLGLWLTARRLHQPQAAALRLIWCWAIVPVLVLSIPQGKHHHYLVPIIAPWAILGAIGANAAAEWILAHAKPRGLLSPAVCMLCLGLPPAVLLVGLHARIAEPVWVTVGLAIFWIALIGSIVGALQSRSIARLTVSAAVALLVIFCWAEAMVAPGTDQTVEDTRFLRRAQTEVPAGVSLYINAKLGPEGNLDFFRTQFYSRPDAVLIHNLSFLRDRDITAPVVYVITRAKDFSLLSMLGTAELIDHSTHSHDTPKDQPAGKWAFGLYRLTFDPHLQRYPRPRGISSLQAMERAPGPWCGPKM